MRKQFYLLLFLLCLFSESMAQPCSSLSVNCTPSESRCVSTGSILVNVGGGSGSYTYKAIGPVNTSATSSSNITGLSPGYYTVEVKDMTTGCVKLVDSVQVTGNYEDPRFQLTKTDVGCSNSDGTISVVNQQYGRGPFTYSIIAPSPMAVGTSNSSGNFSGLTWGEYFVQLTDSCGGIQVRRITIESYFWWFDAVTVTRVGCDSADVSITVRDNKNHLNNVDTSFFNGFSYGYELNGDTTWKTTRQFRIYIGNKRTIKILVRDACGTIQHYIWNLPDNLKPSLDSVQLSNIACLSFSASVSGQNLTNPQYCIYNSGNTLLGCNTTGVFNNLPYGSYCIRATDLCYDTVITRCFTAAHPLPAANATVTITNRNCSTFTATLGGLQNLTLPSICLYDTNNVLISCNPSGIFNNVPYGSYCIKVDDGCIDTVITRCFTVVKPVPVLTSYNITGSNCSSFNVTIGGDSLITPNYCLYDSTGQLITCDSTGIFTGLTHGNYCVRAVSCGDTTNSLCFTSSRPVPSVGSVVITNKQCSFFTATVSGQQNLTNPNFCLYDVNDTLLRCNTTGIFDSLAYGSYCIKVHNTCYDTTITRCFTVSQSVPTINGTMQVLSTTCDSVTFKVNGTNLTQPQYCLYDSLNNLVVCDSSGVFSQPYGYYCVRVEDNCVDTTITVCQTFSPVRGVSLTTSKPCVINGSYVDVTFASGKSPFSIKVYHPNGTLVYDSITTSNPKRVLLPALATGQQYKVVGVDNCGNKDSASIVPNANLVTKTTSVQPKCPSAAWLNGSGDILATCSSNHYAVIPQIIKKNGNNFVSGFSSVSGNTYTFADLEPATYIVEYTQQTCNVKVYDTISVPIYTYPSQGQSALYQCDNNGFSLTADVNGGLSPYTYQIIGSTPSIPSITTSPQANPLFSINTGTIYSLVRLRAVDACGNATLNDVSVLPLQNISINASDSCFFQNIILSVDSVPNAVYYWYKKTTPTDSTLIGSGTSYNLPFFLPEEIGQYVCKMVVNGACVTRVARFDLFGCSNGVLASAVQLQARKAGKVHQLYWNVSPDGSKQFTVERRTIADKEFVTIDVVKTNHNGTHFYNDLHPAQGLNEYRLRLSYPGRNVYTNVVPLVAGKEDIVVYPNPAKDQVRISIASPVQADYVVEMLNSSGRIIYQTELKNIKETVLSYRRDQTIQPGVYLLRIKNMDANTTEIRKLLFE